MSSSAPPASVRKTLRETRRQSSKGLASLRPGPIDDGGGPNPSCFDGPSEASRGGSTCPGCFVSEFPNRPVLDVSREPVGKIRDLVVKTGP